MIHGNGGNDLLGGGAGNDLLDGGLGDDRISARDGDADLLDCGPGRDRAWVDVADRATGCETVIRL